MKPPVISVSGPSDTKMDPEPSQVEERLLGLEYVPPTGTSSREHLEASRASSQERLETSRASSQERLETSRASSRERLETSHTSSRERLDSSSHASSQELSKAGLTAQELHRTIETGSRTNVARGI
jgi:hypothetical protein